MFRNAPRRRVVLVVVFALVGLMTAPIDECDDYAFFQPGTASAHGGVPGDAPDDPDAKAGEGTAHQNVCSCLVCVLTTDDSYAPRLPSPRRGVAVSTAPVDLTSSAYLPAIFRPPIA